MDKLPPELRALQGAMDMVFGAVTNNAAGPGTAGLPTSAGLLTPGMQASAPAAPLECPACNGDRFYKCGHCKQGPTRNIRTNFQYFGWVAVDDATYDGPGSPIGQGKTEHEAIDDLREQMEEREQERANRKAAKEKLCPICLYPEHDPRCVHWEQA